MRHAAKHPTRGRGRQPVVPTRRRARGSSTVEYTLVALLTVVVLITGPNVMSEVIDAFKDMYQAFSYAVGLTYPAPNEFDLDQP